MYFFLSCVLLKGCEKVCIGLASLGSSEQWKNVPWQTSKCEHSTRPAVPKRKEQCVHLTRPAYLFPWDLLHSTFQ